jgi:hypothetical protein
MSSFFLDKSLKRLNTVKMRFLGRLDSFFQMKNFKSISVIKNYYIMGIKADCMRIRFLIA